MQDLYSLKHNDSYFHVAFASYATKIKFVPDDLKFDS